MEGTSPAQMTGTVLGWLSHGHDVLLRGEHGIGKSDFLERLGTMLRRRGTETLRIGASGPSPFAAVLNHGFAPRAALDEASIAAWLLDEVDDRGVILLDDLDRLDAGSARIVARCLAARRCRLVATTSVDPLQLDSEAREIVVARPALQTRIPPLSLDGMSRAIEGVLDSPFDAGVVSLISALSSGNPGVARSLVGAASAGGDHLDPARLHDPPAHSVALLLLADASEEAVRALERLASLGPVPADEAAQSIDPALLADLVDQGRIVEHSLPRTGNVLVVAPPALARELRRRGGLFRSRDLFSPGAPGEDPAAPVDPALGFGAHLPSDAVGGPELVEASSQIASFVLERASTEESEQRREWRATRSVSAANRYLELLLRRPADEEAGHVFRETVAASDEAEEELLGFAFLRLRYADWCGADPETVSAPHVPLHRIAGRFDELRTLKHDLVAEMRDGRTPESLAAVEGAETSPLLLELHAMGRISALLEAGRPDRALEVCERTELSRAMDGCQALVPHHLEALRSESLIYLGRLQEAEQRARRRLVEAYDSCDEIGIRLHSCVLAETLSATGRLAEAWRVLSASLRLGPAGPMVSTFYRRSLTIGIVLQAASGRSDLARALLRQLEAAPSVSTPLIGSMESVARYALGLAEGDPGADASAWAAGEDCAAAGFVLPALFTWMLLVPPLGPDQAELLRRTRASARVPLVDPYIDLQLALAERDHSEAARVLPHVRAETAPQLVLAARELLGLDPGAQTPRDHCGRFREASALTGALSDREREIALLAAAGSSNRDIAGELHLSVRTVENHISHALRKLGLSGRADFARMLMPR